MIGSKTIVIHLDKLMKVTDLIDEVAIHYHDPVKLLGVMKTMAIHDG